MAKHREREREKPQRMKDSQNRHKKQQQAVGRKNKNQNHKGRSGGLSHTMPFTQRQSCVVLPYSGCTGATNSQSQAGQTKPKEKKKNEHVRTDRDISTQCNQEAAPDNELQQRKKEKRKKEDEIAPWRNQSGTRSQTRHGMETAKKLPSRVCACLGV